MGRKRQLMAVKVPTHHRLRRKRKEIGRRRIRINKTMMVVMRQVRSRSKSRVKREPVRCPVLNRWTILARR